MKAFLPQIPGRFNGLRRGRGIPARKSLAEVPIDGTLHYGPFHGICKRIDSNIQLLFFSG
jgi:hypothetical protein